MKKLLIIAGETSGDLHGSHLALSLRRRMPDLRLFGIGGDAMRLAGVEILHDVTRHAAIGILEVSASLHKLIGVFRHTVAWVRRERPEAVVLIDYPDFNLRFARRAHRLGIPVVYYISPQIWAWRTGRVRQVERYVDEMLVIFPFEKDFYERHGVPVKFVGHPLIDILKDTPSRAETRTALGLRADSLVVGLLPGSRTKEFDVLFPLMLEAARQIRSVLGQVQFVLGLGPSIPPGRLESFPGVRELGVLVAPADSHRVMRASDLILVASGTATVEAAILGAPMVMTYKVSWLTWALFIRLMKVANYAMVNIIADRRIVPELVQSEATAANLARAALDLIENRRLGAMRQDLRQVTDRLGPPGAADRAADEIIRLLDARSPGT